MAMFSMRVAAFVLLSFILVSYSIAVDRKNFRKCEDTGFCKRHRKLHNVGQESVWDASLSNVQVTNGEKNGIKGLISFASRPSDNPLEMFIAFFEPGIIRLRVVEDETTTKLSPRYESPDVVLNDQLTPMNFNVIDPNANPVVVKFDSQPGLELQLEHKPFKANVIQNGKVVMSLNNRNYFHFEQRRLAEQGTAKVNESDDANKDGDKDAKEDSREIVDWGEDGKPIYADGSIGDIPEKEENKQESNKDDIHGPESFGKHTDTRPHGATSIGMDVAFPESLQVFGIPEHATTFALKSTVPGQGGYDEPFRLYNLDVFEYEIDEPMTLYGNIPFMVAHGRSASVGLFWNNPSETFVDVRHGDIKGRESHWMSESGVIDVHVVVGPSPKNVSKQFTTIVGTSPLPPMFAIAYHQCRWNYRDEKDVSEVNQGFELHDFPYDVLWLDIEHTDGKRYFTWDKVKFPTPQRMQEELAATGRRMVSIVDPHIKRDDNFPVHAKATELGYYIKDQTGKKDFEGWCWPGSSSYLDFTSPVVREWWSSQFAFDKYVGSTEALFTWNDMNEPSVFNGPEVTMRKDMLSISGVEHREWHNLYGFYQHMATSDGLINRFEDRNKRPFVLTRSFFAGSQRHGAMWTGDNTAEWSHLAIATPMLLSVSIGGITLCGADVGGFFGNPDEELQVRWYGAAIFQPFLRAHAHIETKRREPWEASESAMKMMRTHVRTRYSFLPFWYTLFEHSEREGAPVMRPIWYEYPEDVSTYSMEDQWLVGTDLVVKPIVTQGAESTNIYLPGGSEQPWYDIVTHKMLMGGKSHSVTAKLHQVPVYQRGGSIIPRKMRVRRSSALMIDDPYTLVVALDGKGNANGSLYVDDEVSFDYKRSSKYARVSFEMTRGTMLTTKVELGSSDFMYHGLVEKIIIVGLFEPPTMAVLTTPIAQSQLSAQYNSVDGVLILKVAQNASILEEFSLQLRDATAQG